jgi:mRNA-degrading endonuclease RelE of RelBE toxin-antitoxin system
LRHLAAPAASLADRVAGSIRVIYTVDDGELVVWVVHVRHRSTVYES